MLDTIGYVLLCTINGIFILLLMYVAVWTPKERMKGHSGRSKCRCCSDRILTHDTPNVIQKELKNP